MRGKRAFRHWDLLSLAWLWENTREDKLARARASVEGATAETGLSDSSRAIISRRMRFHESSACQELLARARDHAFAHDLVARRFIGLPLTRGSCIYDT